MNLAPKDKEVAAEETGLKPRRRVAEALVIFTISAVLTRVLSDLSTISSLVSEYLFTLVAAVFILIPYFWLTRKGRSFEAHGLSWKSWKSGAAFGLLMAALTALPFFAGYHLWRTEVHQQRFEFDADNYRQLPIAIEGQPVELNPDLGPRVQLWRTGRRLFARWTAGPGRHRLDVQLESENGQIDVLSGRSQISDPALRKSARAAPTVTFSTTSSKPLVRGASFLVRGGDALKVRVRLDSKDATTEVLRLGPQALKPAQVGEADDKGFVALSRGIWWLPMIVLAQLLVVALPEEFFYRGYLQTTLDDALGGRKKVWRFHLSPAIVITSALFAVGHFIIDLRPARLAVFFPSLLFGWLRDHTGTIASCIVYHAACNLLVEAATHHYF